MSVSKAEITLPIAYEKEIYVAKADSMELASYSECCARIINTSQIEIARAYSNNGLFSYITIGQ